SFSRRSLVSSLVPLLAPSFALLLTLVVIPVTALVIARPLPALRAAESAYIIQAQDSPEPTPRRGKRPNRRNEPSGSDEPGSGESRSEESDDERDRPDENEAPIETTTVSIPSTASLTAYAIH
ncbi:MAG: hypothetical protein AAGJ80_02295, partial [Cyanobacteria bacterium J06553_1]